MSDDYASLDAVTQASLVAKGSVSPLELVDAAIARIEKLNPELNAVIHERFDKARDEARGDLPAGALRGVPMLVKDLDGMTAGDPYHAGSKHLRDARYVADHDSNLQARFKAAGLVIIGRTNTPELGLLPTTEPDAYGPSRNPWSTGHSTGGSSGGSGAAVASRMVALAHAGDGGGSIRIPASECGLVGLFPSRGRHSLGPEDADSWGGLVRRHVLTRSVMDSATVLDAVHGWMPGDPYTAPTPERPFADEAGADPGRLRIGVATSVADPSVVVHADCVSAAEAAGRLLGSLGHDVSDEAPEPFGDPESAGELAGHFLNAFSAWTAVAVEELSAFTGSPIAEDGIEPCTRAVAEMGRSVTAVQFQDALSFFNRFTRRVAAWWESGYDLLLTPTLTEPPPPLGEFRSPPGNPLHGLFRASPLVQFTVPFNITGQPAISLPLHWNEAGLPIGVQLVAAYGREDLLLRVASQLEHAAPWNDRSPPVSA